MATKMDDDEIYAYEQEMQEMDEWEETHANEMEAAEEELRAMEVAEKMRNAKPHAAVTQQQQQPPPPLHAGGKDSSSQDVTANLDGRFAETQERVRSVLERCATALGETDGDAMGDTEMLEDYVARKDKATKMDATTAQFLLARPPIDSDSMVVVLPTGERRFLRKRIPMIEPRRPAAPNVAANSLLPIADLMEALEKRQIEAAMNADKRKEPTPRTAASAGVRDSTLWLDKYKPQRFVDLLSDEKTNREVLGWIKQWDTYVFPGKKTYQPTWSEFETFNPRESNYGSGNGWKNKGFEREELKVDENDPRPREKIILICGPPGAGKTTLANIVARHAGYNPIEVNASDDRTSGVLKNKIINAMEMQSIWGENKPNCIILDEIDGAMNGGDGKSAIAAIQEIVSTPLNTSKDKNGKKTGRQSNKHPLTRPLICICNDQYASVLRPLRKLAKIYVLDTPNSQRLVSRLKVICRDEGIKSTTGALAALCTSGGNDIRYCVNALQFQSTQTKHITSAAVAAGLVGQKDHTRGVFETMDMVFYQSAKAKASATLAQAVMDQIDEASHGLGNFSLLVNALDENLPKMIFNDPTMSKICDAFEWMGLADSWDTAIRSEQQFALMAYVPFAARAVHLACCTSSRRRVEYPKTNADASKKHDKARNILQAFVENSHMQPSMRNSPDVLVVDVVPWLLSTLAPNIRHMTANLQSPEEKKMIQRLIDLMSTLGLSFRPKYMPDGFEDYALEPTRRTVGSWSRVAQQWRERLTRYTGHSYESLVAEELGEGEQDDAAEGQEATNEASSASTHGASAHDDHWLSGMPALMGRPDALLRQRAPSSVFATIMNGKRKIAQLDGTVEDASDGDQTQHRNDDARDRESLDDERQTELDDTSEPLSEDQSLTSPPAAQSASLTIPPSGPIDVAPVTALNLVEFPLQCSARDVNFAYRKDVLRGRWKNVIVTLVRRIGINDEIAPKHLLWLTRPIDATCGSAPPRRGGTIVEVVSAPEDGGWLVVKASGSSTTHRVHTHETRRFYECIVAKAYAQFRFLQA